MDITITALIVALALALVIIGETTNIGAYALVATVIMVGFVVVNPLDFPNMRFVWVILALLFGVRGMSMARGVASKRNR